MENSRAKRLFTRLFVTYPIGYVFLLVLGIIVFVWVAYSIQIPIYKTIESSVFDATEKVVVQIGDVVPMKNTPLYLYESREKHIEKIFDYEVDEIKHVVKISNCKFKNCEKINVDIQIRQVSLLKYIFLMEKTNNI